MKECDICCSSNKIAQSQILLLNIHIMYNAPAKYWQYPISLDQGMNMKLHLFHFS